jgi:hypothetical protein
VNPSVAARVVGSVGPIPIVRPACSRACGGWTLRLRVQLTNRAGTRLLGRHRLFRLRRRRAHIWMASSVLPPAASSSTSTSRPVRPLAVRALRREEATTAVRTLCNAFERMEFSHWLFPDAAARAHHHDQMFTSWLQRAFEAGSSVIVDVTEDLSAVAIWEAPHLDDTTSPAEQSTAAAQKKEEPAESSVPAARFNSNPSARPFFDGVHALAPSQPNWKLAFLGAPERGRGGGTALLKHRLALIGDSAPICLWTGTPENIAYYARFGLEPIARFDMEGEHAAWLSNTPKEQWPARQANWKPTPTSEAPAATR